MGVNSSDGIPVIDRDAVATINLNYSATRGDVDAELFQGGDEYGAVIGEGGVFDGACPRGQRGNEERPVGVALGATERDGSPDGGIWTGDSHVF